MFGRFYARSVEPQFTSPAHHRNTFELGVLIENVIKGGPSFPKSLINPDCPPAPNAQWERRFLSGEPM
jgi:hypothetical protein